MSSFGLICEFNPLHNGHKRILDEARSLGADDVVCIMSGNAVQRGEIAILDKYVRAEAAIRCGADLVLELPFPWSAASAEYFARCGVYIASHFCDTLIFGSECGDIKLLHSAAEFASCERFKATYQNRLEIGYGAAKAYFTALEDEGYRISSNDILGIEYIKAAKRYAPNMTLLTVKREGASYLDDTLGEESCPSATALRRAWQKDYRDTQGYIPKQAYKVFAQSIEQGDMSNRESLARSVMMFFRLTSPEVFVGVAESEGGIANRICTAAKEASDIEDFFERLRSRCYTNAKMRRAMLYCLAAVKAELILEEPHYTTLLGANTRGRAILARNRRREDGISVVTKPADVSFNDTQHQAEECLNAMFTLAQTKPKRMDEMYKKRAYIEGYREKGDK